MKLELTRRGSYAIRAVLVLAADGRHADGDVVPASRISREMDIPVRFLPQVMADLTRAGIVSARLGRSGGYHLARPASEISVLDVIRATEGDARRRTCVLTGRVCHEAGATCDVHEVFSAAQAAILERLSSVTLADVVDGGASSTWRPDAEPGALGSAWARA